MKLYIKEATELFFFEKGEANKTLAKLVIEFKDVSQIVNVSKERYVQMEESIYDLSFMLSLKPDRMAEKVVRENSGFNLIPLNENLQKIYKATGFCFFLQVSFSLLIFAWFKAQTEFYIVNWQVLLARFMAANLIHWQFESKVTHSIEMMKYAGMHPE
jgi:hypothetical protein